MMTVTPKMMPTIEQIIPPTASPRPPSRPLDDPTNMNARMAKTSPNPPSVGATPGKQHVTNARIPRISDMIAAMLVRWGTACTWAWPKSPKRGSWKLVMARA
jgi:hypothetical protein